MFFHYGSNREVRHATKVTKASTGSWVIVVVLPILLLALALLYGKSFWEQVVGYSRTGKADGIHNVPLLKDRISDFQVKGAVSYCVSRHPHGPVHGVFSGVTTEKEIRRFITELCTFQVNTDGGDKRDILDLLNKWHQDDPATFPYRFSADVFVFMGHNKNATRVLGAYRQKDGAFMIDIQFSR